MNPYGCLCVPGSASLALGHNNRWGRLRPTRLVDTMMSGRVMQCANAQMECVVFGSMN